jgi:hypothetical protein
MKLRIIVGLLLIVAIATIMSCDAELEDFAVKYLGAPTATKERDLILESLNREQERTLRELEKISSLTRVLLPTERPVGDASEWDALTGRLADAIEANNNSNDALANYLASGNGSGCFRCHDARSTGK